ncbi:MAG: hypothetical protein HC865_06605 [Cyanobacteria bacterium RU_5_0]|nr:hypothetical protein [Cyanobacteria bacterium RU_5_0]
MGVIKGISSDSKQRNSRLAVSELAAEHWHVTPCLTSLNLLWDRRLARPGRGRQDVYPARN